MSFIIQCVFSFIVSYRSIGNFKYCYKSNLKIINVLFTYYLVFLFEGGLTDRAFWVDSKGHVTIFGQLGQNVQCLMCKNIMHFVFFFDFVYY